MCMGLYKAAWSQVVLNERLPFYILSAEQLEEYKLKDIIK